MNLLNMLNERIENTTQWYQGVNVGKQAGLDFIGTVQIMKHNELFWGDGDLYNYREWRFGSVLGCYFE